MKYKVYYLMEIDIPGIDDDIKCRNIIKNIDFGDEQISKPFKRVGEIPLNYHIFVDKVTVLKSVLIEEQSSEYIR